MRLKGKRAFISGAGSGIGEAAALKFAAEGARVILADIRSPAVEAVAARIVAAGGEAVAVSGDIADPEQCRHMIDEGAMRLGGLDLMFNNAGIVLGEDTGPVETPLEIWEQTIRVNLTGVFLACKFGIPHLLRAGGGAVVNNASVVALVGSAYPQIAYTAAKGGVVAMTREMAVLYGRKGLRFNSVCPGPVGTTSGARLHQGGIELGNAAALYAHGKAGDGGGGGQSCRLPRLRRGLLHHRGRLCRRRRHFGGLCDPR